MFLSFCEIRGVKEKNNLGIFDFWPDARDEMPRRNKKKERENEEV
jgi:hypothetical protein